MIAAVSEGGDLTTAVSFVEGGGRDPRLARRLSAFRKPSGERTGMRAAVYFFLTVVAFGLALVLGVLVIDMLKH